MREIPPGSGLYIHNHVYYKESENTRREISKEQRFEEAKLHLLKTYSNKTKRTYQGPNIPRKFHAYSKGVPLNYPHGKAMTHNPSRDKVIASIYPRDPTLSFILDSN